MNMRKSVAGLLGEKAAPPEAGLAAPGARRLQIVMRRESGANGLGQAATAPGHIPYN